jgi:hypothetical protein
MVTAKVVETVPPFPSFAVRIIVALPGAIAVTVRVLPEMLAVAMFVVLELAV